MKRKRKVIRKRKDGKGKYIKVNKKTEEKKKGKEKTGKERKERKEEGTEKVK